MPDNLIAFNLEGPFTPANNVVDIMQLFPDGSKVISILETYSRISDGNGQGGDIPAELLILIIPFLVLHNIREEQIVDLSVKARLTAGISKLISELEYNSWKIVCLTGAYEQYALSIAQRLGLYAHRIACTPFPLNDFYRTADRNEMSIVFQLEKEIMTPGIENARIRERLDTFYKQQLLNTGLAGLMEAVRPVNGERKLEALNKFATEFSQPLSKWVMVGSESEDSRVLKAVKSAGGLAVAFNASPGALEQSTLAMASTGIEELLDVLNAWARGSHRGVEKLAKEKEKAGSKNGKSVFHWMSGRSDLHEISEIHQRYREAVKTQTT